MSWFLELFTTIVPLAGGISLLFTKALLVLCLGTLCASDVSLNSAAIKHRVHFAVLLCLAALPLLTWIAPRWHLPVAMFTPPLKGDSGAWLWPVLMLAYLTGVAVKALLLLADLLTLLAVTMRANPASRRWQRSLETVAEPSRRIRILSSREIDSPVTWGWLNPLILVPQQDCLSASEREMALRHELGHVQRGDWLAHVLGRIVEALYWPIPGLRSTVKDQALTSEIACDNYVLQARHQRSDYASLLLAQARNQRLRAAVTLSRQSELEQRIRSICSAHMDRSVCAPGWPWLVPLSLLLALPLAGMQPGNPPGGAFHDTGARPTLTLADILPPPEAAPSFKAPVRIPAPENSPAFSAVHSYEIDTAQERPDLVLADDYPAALVTRVDINVHNIASAIADLEQTVYFLLQPQPP